MRLSPKVAKVKTAAKPKASSKGTKKTAKQPKAEDFVDFKATSWPGPAGSEVPEGLRSAVNKLQWKVVNDNLRPQRAAKAAKTRKAKAAKAAKQPKAKAAKPKASTKPAAKQRKAEDGMAKALKALQAANEAIAEILANRS